MFLQSLIFLKVIFQCFSKQGLLCLRQRDRRDQMVDQFCIWTQRIEGKHSSSGTEHFDDGFERVGRARGSALPSCLLKKVE